jgi:hypothetical protein
MLSQFRLSQFKAAKHEKGTEQRSFRFPKWLLPTALTLSTLVGTLGFTGSPTLAQQPKHIPLQSGIDYATSLTIDELPNTYAGLQTFIYNQVLVNSGGINNPELAEATFQRALQMGVPGDYQSMARAFNQSQVEKYSLAKSSLAAPAIISNQETTNGSEIKHSATSNSTNLSKRNGTEIKNPNLFWKVVGCLGLFGLIGGVTAYKWPITKSKVDSTEADTIISDPSSDRRSRNSLSFKPNIEDFASQDLRKLLNLDFLPAAGDNIIYTFSSNKPPRQGVIVTIKRTDLAMEKRLIIIETRSQNGTILTDSLPEGTFQPSGSTSTICSDNCHLYTIVQSEYNKTDYWQNHSDFDTTSPAPQSADHPQA